MQYNNDTVNKQIEAKHKWTYKTPTNFDPNLFTYIDKKIKELIEDSLHHMQVEFNLEIQKLKMKVDELNISK
jgi:hypothetical protein